MSRPTYWHWIRTEAARVNSDGCTLVTDIRIDCCYEHDLAYRFGCCPRSAYRAWCRGSLSPWQDAKPLSRGTADARFRRCIQQRSPVGRFSPVAAIRWVGVRVGGWLSWGRYRRREAQPEEPRRAA